MPPTDFNGMSLDDLYAFRRDTAGVSSLRVPKYFQPHPSMDAVGRAHLLLRHAGATLDGSRYVRGGNRFRILNGRTKLISEIRQDFAEEPSAPPSSFDEIIVCAGKEVEVVRIVEEARNVLEKYHYIVSSRGEDMLQFEDETLLGFVCELSVESLLETWSRRQDEFLKSNARILANSALKAWNLYSVFLSSDVPDENARKSLITIEEDFRASRKIVFAGIQTVADVARALYPFIPIQNIAALETSDSLRKLRGRLSALPTAAVDVLLNERMGNNESILKSFQEAYEIKTN